MKVILGFSVAVALLCLVAAMPQGNNKNNKNNINKNAANVNPGTKVTLFPCNNQLLREERIINGPPEKDRVWKGFVKVQNANRNKNNPLIVTIVLDFPTQFNLNKKDGKIVPGSKGNYWKIAVFPKTKILRFSVKGRPHEPLPSITSLQFRDNEKCKAPIKWDEKAELISKLPPPPPAPPKEPIEDSDPDVSDEEIPFEPIIQPVYTTTTPRPKPLSSCGVRQLTKQAYVTNGYASVPGDWPWHAAMYHKSQRTLSYKCGGTLISNKHVLTAAHCLFSAGSPIIPERVIIQLGKYNLQFNDVNTAEYQVFDIKIHEKYSNYDFNDDIALLKLAQEVIFTNYIQPACLWSPEKTDLATVVNRQGYVCGWGLAEDDELSDTLTEATMPVVDFFTCLESNRDFFGPVLSQFNYCAGYKNGTSVCNGDSGGGMFFQEGGVWHVRGIVSFSAIREDRNVCNPLEYVIFTDVAKYLPWLQENM